MTRKLYEFDTNEICSAISNGCASGDGMWDCTLTMSCFDHVDQWLKAHEYHELTCVPEKCIGEWYDRETNEEYTFDYYVCPNCQNELYDDDRYCSECGARVVRNG